MIANEVVSYLTLFLLYFIAIKETLLHDNINKYMINMLTLNETLKCLVINSTADNLSFLTTCLFHNTSLQGLSVPITLSDTYYEQVATFFRIISQRVSSQNL